MLEWSTTATKKAMNPDTDTIVAIATPAGRGGVGMLRISGARAFAVAGAISHLPVTDLAPRTVYYATFRDADGHAIDQGLVLPFRGPASFTGEDVVELHGHGGAVVMDLLLRACLAQNARLARPGEFSARAFLNDKMDLAQAEAIADLIDSQSEAAARGAVRSMQGVFSARVRALVDALVQLRVYVEAAIDFPEEEVDFLADGEVAAQLAAIERDLDVLLAEARTGTLLREGLSLVIAGKPNAGKSSLLNALAGRDAAIVTPIAGTTRDVLREHLAIDGIPLHLIDTAGLRDSDDAIEQEGIRRAWAEIRNADIVLLLVDGSVQAGIDPQQLWPDFVRELQPKQTLIVVRNKCDLSGEMPGEIAPLPQPPLWERSMTATTPAVAICAKTGDGVPALKSVLRRLAGAGDIGEGQFIARRRHLDALQRARAALANGRAQLEQHRAGELLAEDLRTAQQALGEITGELSADDLLGEIFGSFCIGK